MQAHNAEILIENKQCSEDGDEVFNVTAPCKFMIKENKAYILYEDNGITSKIKTDGKTVTVTRMGKFSGEMVYKEGETTSFLYKMPYGTTEMQIVSECVNVVLSENGGSIFLKYKLMFSGAHNENSMNISIRLKK